MGEIVKEMLIHIDVLDFADELGDYGDFKSLTPVAVWFDKGGMLVVEFEGERA